MKSPGGGKALLFENPTVDGKASQFPVAINTMGSRRRMALALPEAVPSEDGAAFRVDGKLFAQFAQERGFKILSNVSFNVAAREEGVIPTGWAHRENSAVAGDHTASEPVRLMRNAV
jgi:UbiD family decarboxylase